MKHSVTIRTNWHKVFLVVNLIIFANCGNWSSVMYVYEFLTDFAVFDFKTHSANSTATSFLLNTFLSCFRVPFVSIYKDL